MNHDPDSETPDRPRYTWTPPSPVVSVPWGPEPAAPPAQPPHRSRGGSARQALVLVALFAGAAGGSAVGIGALTSHTSQGTSSRAAASAGTSGGQPSGAAATTPAPQSSGAAADATAIAAAVDPAVVDITTTLANQGGTAAGTGMVITSSGEVLTNNHVIDGASSITVQIGGSGRSYSAKVLGYDVADDIALLQIQGVSGLQAVALAADGSTLSVGDSVVAIGNALGQGGTPVATQGAVTALQQTITASSGNGASETLAGLIEMNAPIQPGDSGGPLVSASGRVVGIDTAAQVTGGRFRQPAASTTGYAIPIATAMTIVRQIESGTASSVIQVGDRPLLGVNVQDTAAGATVAAVGSGTPAATAGLAAGDVIISIGGTAVTSAATLETAILAHHPGDRVAVVWVDRSGAHHTATIQLSGGPPA